MEEWRDIVGYEEMYQVSNFGNIRRIQRGKKLDPELVTIAKKMLSNGTILRIVAQFLDTSIATCSMIKNGKTWSGDTSYRTIKKHIGSDHYLYICLCKNGKYKKRPIHRIMWEAFNGPIPKGFDVNHKNLDRQYNVFANLEVITHKDNCQHAHNIYAEERKHLPKGERGAVKGRYHN